MNFYSIITVTNPCDLISLQISVVLLLILISSFSLSLNLKAYQAG